MKKFSALLAIPVILFTLSALQAGAQGISINSNQAPPDPSAVLDVSSSDKGMLIPRMSTTERNAIGTPAEGLMIFNTTTKCFEAYVLGAWNASGCPGCSTAASPGNITGSSSVCSGSVGNSYSVAAVPGATSYAWSVPSGSSITSGQGTNSVQVSFGSSSGIVTVAALNACGSSLPNNMLVSVNPPAPATPGSITGNATVCANTTGVSYSISPVANALVYTWSVPSGATITNGQGSTSILVNFGSSSGNVSVTAGNSCGTSSASSLSITIPVPGGQSQTFSYTGGAQTFTVPSCVTSVGIDAYGGQGEPGVTSTGKGGRATGTLAVTPGQVLNIYVGGRGIGNVAGYNGGGGGATAGGGASDVRVGGVALANRVIVAGGGGAVGGTNITGGSGGGTNGGNGGDHGSVSGGSGGSQASGGSGGSGANGNGGSGSLGQGGNGASGGGGGGGGYYGGGGGGRNEGQNLSSGGGGGSGYIGGVTSGSMTNGIQTGNGQIIITW